jgi:teichuronic acid biosynthesis glycosyltransferase TuaH
MLKDRDIVCIANTPWEGDYQKSTVLLLSRLAEHNRVLYVAYARTIKDLFVYWKNKNLTAVKQMLGITSRLHQVPVRNNRTAQVLTLPPVWPYAMAKGCLPLFKLILFVNALLVRGTIKKAIQTLNMKNVISITAFNPFFGLYLRGYLHEEINLYYCYDGIQGKRYGRAAHLLEKEFIEKIDGVIVTNPALAQEKSAWNQNCHVVKNGVDFPLFSSVVSASPRPVHARKVIGYIGSVDQRFDIPVVRWCIEHLPECDFVIVGRVLNADAASTLRQYPNVIVKSPVSPGQVPAIMYGSDVGIIPYTRTPINRNVYPLKINEYLAVGTPVVMTDFAELTEFNDVVSTAHSKEEFLQAIRHILETDSAEQQKRRMQVAGENSWDKRAEEFSSAVEKTISAKRTPRQYERTTQPFVVTAN